MHDGQQHGYLSLKLEKADEPLSDHQTSACIRWVQYLVFLSFTLLEGLFCDLDPVMATLPFTTAYEEMNTENSVPLLSLTDLLAII